MWVDIFSIKVLSGGFTVKMVIIKIAIGLVIILFSFIFLLKSGEDSLLSMLMKKRNINPGEANNISKSDDETNDSCDTSKDEI